MGCMAPRLGTQTLNLEKHMSKENSVAIPSEVDLVVAGGGLAGHCAALEAAEHGATVVLLEKREIYGGSTVQSSGSFAFAGTQAQRDAGIDDSPDKITQDIVSASGGLADPALVDLYVTRQADTYAWLKEHGVNFHPVTLSSNQGVPRTHATDPWQLMQALHERVRAHERISYLNKTAIRSLMTSATARVEGVKVERDGDEHSIRARRGVVLATGGFSRNAELIFKFAPQLKSAMKHGGTGNTGDGLLLAWKLGADFLDTAYINGTFGISLNNYPDTRIENADEAVLKLAIYRGGIAVNLNAERFADESISYKKLGELCLAQPQGVAFQVWDQNIMDLSVPNPNSTDFKSAYEKGLVRSANDLESLAKRVGLDPVRFTRTVLRYNADVKEGRDTVFGRTNLGKGYGKLVALERAPFYIYPCTTAVLSTYCGLRVNRDMQLLDVFGKPLAGLFAAGEIVGGFHGSGYMSGSSLAKSAIFGRVAAGSALRC
jgi:fumarate reductase flavoprotein subunit